MIASPVKSKRIFQSSGVCFKLNRNPKIELMAIITNEVPIAVFIGSFTNNTNAGMIRKPPPAPNKPVIKPIADPHKASGNILLLRSGDTGIFLF